MIRFLSAFAAVLFLFGGSAFAQVPSVPGPYNNNLGALVTNTLAQAGTVYSAQQTNLAGNGVVCTFDQTAHSGTPQTTFFIQQYDAASASYFTLVTSGTITADNTPTAIEVYPGVQTATLPSPMVAVGLKLPRTYRVGQTIVNGGGGAATTGTIGCNLLK